MTAKRILTCLLIIIVVLTGRMLLGFGESAEKQPAQKTQKPSPVIVGTFDSRAVMFAYGSASRAGRMPHIEVSKPIEFRQGFGKGDVSEYLDYIRDEIPKIAKKAGVDVIVSKWAVEYHDPNAIFVDVTEALIQPFEPSKEALEMIKDLKKTPPGSEKQIRELEQSGKEI